jgi:membrane-associated protease RseP (regulator of RpoE activity)
MVDFISKSIWEGITFLFIIGAIISINLWVFNLLPIPALDWWRFFLINLNWLMKLLFWKKIISENMEWIIHILFFIILIALSLIIWYNDVTKLFN